MQYLKEGSVCTLRGRHASLLPRTVNGVIAVGGVVLLGMLGTGNAAWAQKTTKSASDATMKMSSMSVMRPSANTQATMPSSVLLFPATAPADAAAPAAGSATAMAMRHDSDSLITDAVRRFLTKGGIGVVVYSRRLPSIERAVNEGMKPDDAAKGPGDDPRKAQRFADMVGAEEYLTVIVDDYKWDPSSRTVTFNLSVTRNAGDGGSLGATAQKAIGTAPNTIPASRQESYAVDQASDVVGEQVVEALYPGSAARINPPKEKMGRKKKGNLGKSILIPAAAIAGAIIGTHS